MGRWRVILGTAFAVLLASTGIASAAELSERAEVMLCTGAVVIVLLAIVSVFYLLRHALGADKMPPAEPQAGDHH